MVINMSVATVSAALLCCSLLAGVEAQVPFLGPCPAVNTAQNFTVHKYLGRWYEAERYFSLMEFAGKCVTTDISDLGSSTNHTQLSILTRQTSWMTDIQSTMRGQMRPLDQNGDSAKMYMRFSPMDLSLNHWVLETDYDNYAVVFSCADLGSVLSTRSAWILTRARHPTLDVMEKAYSVIDKNDISKAYFIRVDQSEKNCPDEPLALVVDPVTATQQPEQLITDGQ